MDREQVLNYVNFRNISGTVGFLTPALAILLLPEAQTPLKEITNNPNFQDFFLHSINLSKSLTIFEMYVGLVVPLLTTTIAYNIGFSLDILTKIYKPNFWDINAEIYKLITTKVHKQLYKDILKQAGNLENKTIDEYGFGLGNLIELMPNSAIIRGFDISQTAKEKTEKLIGDKADLYLKDFYELANLDYKPEIIIASKVLYHPNLEESIEVLNNNIDPKGKVIIAHPKKKEKDYIFINQKGKKRLNLIALIKSSSRILSKYFSYNYSLFTEQEWQKNK